MAYGTTKTRELERTLKLVINALEDSQNGMAEIGQHLKDPTLRRYFLVESLRRANFRAELENVLHRTGIHDVHETGTATGALYRAWAELKAKLGGGDRTLLETADAVALLASGRLGYMTGHPLVVDGGMSAL